MRESTGTLSQLSCSTSNSNRPMRLMLRRRTLERQCMTVTSTQLGSLRAPVQPSVSILEERKSFASQHQHASIQLGAKLLSATNRPMISSTTSKFQWACHTVRSGETWTAVMALSATRTSSASRAAAATLSRSRTSAACQYWASIVRDVTQRGTMDAISTRILSMSICKKRHLNSTPKRGLMRQTPTMSFRTSSQS